MSVGFVCSIFVVLLSLSVTDVSLRAVPEGCVSCCYLFNWCQFHAFTGAKWKKKWQKHFADGIRRHKLLNNRRWDLFDENQLKFHYVICVSPFRSLMKFKQRKLLHLKWHIDKLYFISTFASSFGKKSDWKQKREERHKIVSIASSAFGETRQRALARLHLNPSTSFRKDEVFIKHLTIVWFTVDVR